MDVSFRGGSFADAPIFTFHLPFPSHKITGAKNRFNTFLAAFNENIPPPFFYRSKLVLCVFIWG